MIRLFFVAIFGLALVAPSTVAAETVVRFAETVAISDTQAIESDFYVLAGTAVMSGSVAGDMYVVGGTVTVNGPIAADFSALSGRTVLSATVTDDVRLVSGEAIISGPVGGDVFMLGGSLQILSTATIAGDVYMFGGEADIAGPVGGSVLGTYTNLRIDSAVSGMVDVRTTAALTLGAQADIAGDVRYQSQSSLVRAPEAVVAGVIVATTPTATTSAADMRTILIPFLILLFSVLVVYLVAKRGLDTITTQALTHPLRAAVIGLIVLVMLPVTAVLLLVTSLGALLGVILLAAWLALLVLAYIITPVIVGVWVGSRMGQRSISLLSVVAGVSLFYALSLVPVINIPVILLGVLVSLGALCEDAYRRLRT